MGCEIPRRIASSFLHVSFSEPKTVGYLGGREALAHQRSGASGIFRTVDELPDQGGRCARLGLGLRSGAQVDLTAGWDYGERPSAGGASAECLEYLSSSRVREDG